MWLRDAGQSYLKIVRQQYNFSPPATTSEFEDYTVDLVGVTSLEINNVQTKLKEMSVHRLRSCESHNI